MSSRRSESIEDSEQPQNPEAPTDESINISQYSKITSNSGKNSMQGQESMLLKYKQI